MNVAPQDSTTTSQRRTVEGLRAYSDQNNTFSRLANRNSNIGRDLIQARDFDFVSNQALLASDTRPISNSYTVPQIPLHHHRRPGAAQYSIPQRLQSLRYEPEQAALNPHTRATTMMLNQQTRPDENTDALRRRMNAVSYMPNAANLIPMHTTDYTTAPNLGRSSFPQSNLYPSRITSHQTDTEASGEERGRNAYNLPRWQPDAEVTNCPICGHVFSFWFRKHHCRKCGRVVCANCSPHRITIPRQYIVNAPSVHPVEIDLTGTPVQDNNAAARLAADQLHLSVGGGQEVRLCNPCVPDPNPLPPSQHYPLSSNAFSVSEPPYVPRTMPENHLTGRRRSYHMGGASENYTRYHGNPLTRHRTYQSQHNPLNSNSAAPYGSAPDSLALYLSRYGHGRPHRHHTSLSALPTPRRPSMFEDMTTPELPIEDSPQRQIAEEDECPICHEELPPKGLDGSETEREAHVTSCIDAHFSSSRPKDDLNNRPDESTAELSTTPAQVGSSLSNPILPGPSSRRRTNGMLVYNATEKDCVGEDGTPQECIICFEDFEAGTEMGRLECLCKFHKVCLDSCITGQH